eukprot:scaffold4761_cov105-Skeletonema_dohrnii-CCMP3373.AAC.4
MKSITQRDYKQSLRAFSKEVVVLHTLVCDPLRSQRGEEVRRLIHTRKTQHYVRLLERGTSWSDGQIHALHGIDENGPRACVEIMNLAGLSDILHELGGSPCVVALYPHVIEKMEIGDQVTKETKRDKRQSFMFMNDVRRTFGNATTLPSKEEVILPTIEEETAEEIYAILLDAG